MKETWRSVCMTLALISITVAFVSCKKQSATNEDPTQIKGKIKMDVQKSVFGKMPDGSEIELYTLTNNNGLKARIMTYGAILVSLDVLDRNGKLADITLGYDSLEEYLQESAYFGAIVGRFGNRIASGKFTLKGVKYQLATNNGKHHLHGGIKGFDKVAWKAEPVGIKHQLVAKDIARALASQIKVAVISKIDWGCLVRLYLVVDLQFILICKGIDYDAGEIAWIAFFSILTEVA